MCGLSFLQTNGFRPDLILSQIIAPGFGPDIREGQNISDRTDSGYEAMCHSTATLVIAWVGLEKFQKMLPLPWLDIY